MKNVLFIATLFFLSSCVKNNIENYEENFTGGSSKAWTLTKVVMNDGSLGGISECVQSSELIFVSDGTWLTNQTDRACDPTIYDGTWTMNEDTLFRTITTNGIPEPMSETIIEILTPRKLRFSSPGSNTFFQYKN